MGGGRRRDPSRAVVCCLDDDGDWLEILTETYLRRGIAFRGYAYPEQLRAFVEYAKWIDILLIDVRLPGINGADLAAEILKTGINGQVILISGLRRHERPYGFANYLSKDEIVADPMTIFRVPDDEVAQALSASVLACTEVR